jgi:site-specific DNA-methyltransferase (adenine-specific)
MNASKLETTVEGASSCAAIGCIAPVQITPSVGSGAPGVGGVSVLVGDSRKLLPTLPSESVNCCVTSPPYWGLRDYGHADQIGQEATPEEFVQSLVDVFREVRRVLKSDGTLWLNLGDSYDGKSLAGVPWRVALALKADGWLLRSDIIWSKPNPMPESVTDRCTKSHEYIFMLSKGKKYYFDAESIREKHKWQDEDELKVNAQARQQKRLHEAGKVVTQVQRRDDSRTKRGRYTLGLGENVFSMSELGKNKRTVWTVNVAPFDGCHFATFPPDLILPCVLAGCPAGGVVLDPFGGSGTTGMVAIARGRRAILIELNQEYAKIIDQRTHTTRGFGF